jgi:hypothetical protein
VDTATGALTEMGIAALPYGHDAFGYGMSVNQDCCVATAWDAAQWQLRGLSAPLVTRDLITKVVSPKEIYLGEHTTWNNARRDALVPVVSGLYRLPRRRPNGARGTTRSSRSRRTQRPARIPRCGASRTIAPTCGAIRIRP